MKGSKGIMQLGTDSRPHAAILFLFFVQNAEELEKVDTDRHKCLVCMAYTVTIVAYSKFIQRGPDNIRFGK